MRIALTAIGGYGDINPLLLIGKALQARGHEVTFATSLMCKAEVVAAGLNFHPTRPDSLIQPANDPYGLQGLAIREGFFARLSESFADLRALATSCDLLISHVLAFGAPLVAEATGIRWVSVVLQPFGFLSRFERLVVPTEFSASGLTTLDSWTSYFTTLHCRRQWWLWSDSVRQARAELGLSPGRNPLYDDQHSPELVLGLFSALLSDPKPDWPASTCIAGFVFDEDTDLPDEAERFLRTGPAPLIATLGSHAENDFHGFYMHTIIAAVMLGMRCMLLGSGTPELVETLHRENPYLRRTVAGFNYIPYRSVFPRADIIVHHGGIGTIAAALHAGKRMLIVPQGHDQLQNAMCAVGTGCARAVSQRRYNFRRAVAEISTLLYDARYKYAAARARAFVNNEDGTATACAAIEGMDANSKLC